MSTRVSKNPIKLPSGVEVSLKDNVVDVKGSKGQLSFTLPKGIKVEQGDNTLQVVMAEKHDNVYALAGTTRAILNNHVKGVSEGFDKKLQLVGVGYRAQAGKAGTRSKLDLTLGRETGVVRLNINRTPRHIRAQLIDPKNGNILACASSLEADLRAKKSDDGKKGIAVMVGKLIAERAKKAGVEKVACDRSGFKFHGRVAALVNAARENGLRV